MLIFSEVAFHHNKDDKYLSIKQINIRLFSCELHFNPNKYKEVYNESTYSESDGRTLNMV